MKRREIDVEIGGPRGHARSIADANLLEANGHQVCLGTIESSRGFVPFQPSRDRRFESGRPDHLRHTTNLLIEDFLVAKRSQALRRTRSPGTTATWGHSSVRPRVGEQ